MQISKAPMELVERSGHIHTLNQKLEDTISGEGHCVLITGEAGIGKTSLVKRFSLGLKNQFDIYTGACDPLFVPGPLAPLREVLQQWGEDFSGHPERAGLFAAVVHSMSRRSRSFVIIFEDIHWADEATLDFIKYFVRRIGQTHCLLILTYRDDEIHPQHPLLDVLGQIPASSFSRLALPGLSSAAVEKMASDKGFDGKEVYAISAGNPFYVTEILANPDKELPDNIRDAVLAVYNKQPRDIRLAWDYLSVMPAGFDIRFSERSDPGFLRAIESSLGSAVVIPAEAKLIFKHELFRRAIEQALSPFRRVELHRKILRQYKDCFEQEAHPERIVHHAKEANDTALVVQYAPASATVAAAMSAHIEAAKLYRLAIMHYHANDTKFLLGLYEPYAYECYLTNQLKEAIAFQTKALALHRKTGNRAAIGNCERFLSRLWWFDGNRKHAEFFAAQAVETLKPEPASPVKAMALSNMSQLKMLSEQTKECLAWGRKAIAMAKQLKDRQILSHALNNVGAVQMGIPSKKKTGIRLLKQSLQIALDHDYHEHAARAYTNLASYSIITKDYAVAKKSFDAGILYCQDRDLDSWAEYMLSWKARWLLETGQWQEARQIAANLLQNPRQTSIIKISAWVVAATVGIRTGNEDPTAMLTEAKEKAFEALELQRIGPVFSAMMECEWISGKKLISKKEMDAAVGLTKNSGNLFIHSEFSFWLQKTGRKPLRLPKIYPGYDITNAGTVSKAVQNWAALGCPYEQALLLFEGGEPEKKKALAIIDGLGAKPVAEKLKQQMRHSGMRKIPRGVRKSTKANLAGLTARELNVLEYLTEGLQSKEIASLLFISVKTVDNHIASILFKLDVNTRVKAVRKAGDMGILSKR